MKIFKKIAYYSIFFTISGILHYYYCFYMPEEKTKVVNVSALAVAVKPLPKPEEKPPEPQKQPETQKPPEPQKQPEAQKPEEPKPTPPPPTPKPELKEDPNEKNKEIQYRENLEKELTQKWQQEKNKLEEKHTQELEKLKQEHTQAQQAQQAQMQEMKNMNEQLAKQLNQITQQVANLEKKKQEDIAEIKKQQDKTIEELKKNQDKTIEELKKNQDQQIKNLQKQQEEKLQTTLASEQKKYKSLLEQQSTELAQLKKDNKTQTEALNERLEKNQKDLAQAQKDLAQAQKSLAQAQHENKTQVDTLTKNLAATQQKLEDAIVADTTKLANTHSTSAAEEKVLLDKQWENLQNIRVDALERHKNLVQKFSTNFDKNGVVVPAISFYNNTFAQNRNEIMAFHRMNLVAYPETNKYFLTVNLTRSQYDGRYQRRTDFSSYFSQLSTRSIAAEEGFPYVVQEIKNNSAIYSPKDGDISLAFVFPFNTANYIAWKSVTVCKKFGYKPEDVQICFATFKQTRTGYWSLIIFKLRLKNFTEIPVEDFEEKWQ